MGQNVIISQTEYKHLKDSRFEEWCEFPGRELDMVGIFSHCSESPPGWRGILIQPLVYRRVHALKRRWLHLAKALVSQGKFWIWTMPDFLWGRPALVSFPVLCASRSSQLALWFPDLMLPELGKASPQILLSLLALLLAVFPGQTEVWHPGKSLGCVTASWPEVEPSLFSRLQVSKLEFQLGSGYLP